MNFDYSAAPTYATILALLWIAAGLAIAAGGYRFRRMSVAATALFAAGDYVTAIFAIADSKFMADETWYHLTFFAAGATFGALALFHTKAGVGIAGFCAGVELASMLLYMADFRGSVGVNGLVLTLAGAICTALTLALKKPGLVAATSFVGADICINGARYFVYKAVVQDVGPTFYATGAEAQKMEAAWWITCAISLALFAAGATTQHFVTARDIDHDSKQCGTDRKAGTTLSMV